jgi:rfaE bifunctional protein nucleotidyltransferase chain/domain
MKVNASNKNTGLLNALYMLCLGLFVAGCETFSDTTNQALIQSYQPSKYTSKFCEKQKVVLVGGCFDVLHIGHVEFLNAAKNEGDYLIVALEPDSSIKSYKKRKPIHTQAQRAKILSNLRSVDEVLLLPSLKGFDGYKKLVQDIHPSVIAVTQGDPQLNNKKLQAECVNARVVEVLQHIKGYSSSKIIGSKNTN